VLVVEAEADRLEERLAAGRMTYPNCGDRLSRWGYARPRTIRGRHGEAARFRPRRARCTGCGSTHVLLPDVLWPRCSETAEVIGVALEIAAAGMGHRRIAVRLGRAEDTVRGWVRRFRRGSEEVRRFFTVALVALAEDPVMPEPAGSPLADAVAAVAAAHRAAAGRWPRMLTVSRWAFAGRAIRGRVLTCAVAPV